MVVLQLFVIFVGTKEKKTWNLTSEKETPD